MKLNTSLKVILVILSILFIVLEGLDFELESAGVSSLALVTMISLYLRTQKNKFNFFFYFLILFTLANALTWISLLEITRSIDPEDNLYFICNILFILSYLSLIVHILKSINVKKVISEFRITILILFVLDLFCVVIVTNTTEGVLPMPEYSLEFVYNVIIMSFLTIATLNYMHRSDHKSILLLIGSVCIVFSEMIQLAYYYIIDNQSLGFVYSILLVIAFLLFYLQSQKVYTGPELLDINDYEYVESSRIN